MKVEHKNPQVQSPLEVIFVEFILLFPTQAYIVNIVNFVLLRKNSIISTT